MFGTCPSVGFFKFLTAVALISFMLYTQRSYRGILIWPVIKKKGPPFFFTYLKLTFPFWKHLGEIIIKTHFRVFEPVIRWLSSPTNKIFSSPYRTSRRYSKRRWRNVFHDIFQKEKGKNGSRTEHNEVGIVCFVISFWKGKKKNKCLVVKHIVDRQNCIREVLFIERSRPLI